MSCSQNFRMFDDYHTPTPDQQKIEKQIEEKIPNIDEILNKYLNCQELTDVQLQQLSQHQRFILEQIKNKNNKKKKKRSDEYQKIFYKKTFKFAQKKFFAKNKQQKSRRMSHFYHHYFDKVATTMGISLINFYHPDKKTRPGLKSGQKSFNSSYIRLLLKSQNFKEVAMEYHKKFVNECLKERNKKIISFSRSLMKVMQKNKNNRQEIAKYMQSSQCKIPWTNNEINEAWRRAGMQIQDQQDEQSSKTNELEKDLENFEGSGDQSCYDEMQAEQQNGSQQSYNIVPSEKFCQEMKIQMLSEKANSKPNKKSSDKCFQGLNFYIQEKQKKQCYEQIILFENDIQVSQRIAMQEQQRDQFWKI